MQDNSEDDQPPIKKETINSANSVILCDSIESAIELSYVELDSDKIAYLTQMHIEICLN